MHKIQHGDRVGPEQPILLQYNFRATLSGNEYNITAL